MKEKSETKDLAMTPKEQEMDLRRWCVEVSVKICDKESIIEVAEKTIQMDYTIENDVKSGSNSCARPDFKH